MKPAISQTELAELNAASNDHALLAQLIAGCRLGDIESRRALEKNFYPLLVMLATKRVGANPAARNPLIENGKQGLRRAVDHFPKRALPRRFRIFALDYIEAAMDRKPGFWSRLAGK
jgi:DNA-directed RNA polymerase specialized sigma subunit